MTLEHEDPDCTGTWQAEAEGPSRYWRCDACGVLYQDTVRVQKAATKERRLGWLLRTLTRTGGAE